MIIMARKEKDFDKMTEEEKKEYFAMLSFENSPSADEFYGYSQLREEEEAFSEREGNIEVLAEELEEPFWNLLEKSEKFILNDVVEQSDINGKNKKYYELFLHTKPFYLPVDEKLDSKEYRETLVNRLNNSSIFYELGEKGGYTKELDDSVRVPLSEELKYCVLRYGYLKADQFIDNRTPNKFGMEGYTDPQLTEEQKEEYQDLLHDKMFNNDIKVLKQLNQYISIVMNSVQKELNNELTRKVFKQQERPAVNRVNGLKVKRNKDIKRDKIKISLKGKRFEIKNKEAEYTIRK